MNEIVVDLETIPQQGLSRELLSIVERKVANKRGDNKDISKYQSLNAEFGQIVAIGVMQNDYSVVYAGAEKDILELFWGAMFEVKSARIVGFNSKNFDIPYIKKRSAILGILPSTSLSTRRYDTERHFDCMEVLSNFGANDYMSLSDYCKIFSIPHDDTVSGADVYALWKAGNIEEIKAHCVSDVTATFALYNKIKHYF